VSSVDLDFFSTPTFFTPHDTDVDDFSLDRHHRIWLWGEIQETQCLRSFYWARWTDREDRVVNIDRHARPGR
jgi:hypothetical protein